MSEKCSCGSNIIRKDCCELIIKKRKVALTPEELMRSRYVAYTISDIDYLIETTHPTQRKYYSPKEIEKWAKSNQWNGLEIISSVANLVEFKAYYLDSDNHQQVHYEKSTFVFENGKWYYLEGDYE